MESAWNQALEEEVARLRDLRDLMNEERACLARMDPVGLLDLARRKERAAARIRVLAGRRAGLPMACTGQETRGLFEERARLVEDLRVQSRTHAEILQAERVKLGQILAFLKVLRSDGTTYDQSGKLR